MALKSLDLSEYSKPNGSIAHPLGFVTDKLSTSTRSVYIGRRSVFKDVNNLSLVKSLQHADVFLAIDY